MLLVLKIPLVYLCLVVWWAIRAEPRPQEGAALLASVEPTPPCEWRRRLAAARARRQPSPRPWRPLGSQPVAHARAEARR